MMTRPHSPLRQGLLHHWAQFSLLVLVNAFVGGMVGLERSILPLIAEIDFKLSAHTAILSFIVIFGLTKAMTNYYAGRYADRYGRRIILISGWLIACPVPFMLMWAQSWNWILLANVFLGISQGLTWSLTVIMKIDLVGPKQRGLAMGVNESAGYLAVAASAFLTGYVAAHYGVRPEPFYLGVLFVICGLLLSGFCIRETRPLALHESASHVGDKSVPTHRQLFKEMTFRNRNLSSITQNGLVNNLNDGMAWGLFPLVYASVGMSFAQIGWLSAIYPAVWGGCQLFTGALSDRVGRKPLIVMGMWLQALGITVIAWMMTMDAFIMGSVMLGIGTAMVYPTLLASIGDIVNPAWRASAIGVYRLWRDLGYVFGAIISGLTADMLGIGAALMLVACLTFVSGVITAYRMRESLNGRH